GSSSPTSRPATSTAPPRRRSSGTCAAASASSATPSSWSPTRSTPPRTPTTSCCWPMARSPTTSSSPTPTRCCTRCDGRPEMRTVALASVRQHARRYVAAGLAIAIGVAFVVLVNGLASSARAGIQADLDAEYAGTEHVLADPGSDEVAAAVDTAAGHGASVAIVASAYLPVTADGVRLDDSAEIGVIPTDPALQWQDLVAGSFPDGPD